MSTPLIESDQTAIGARTMKQAGPYDKHFNKNVTQRLSKGVRNHPNRKLIIQL